MKSDMSIGDAIEFYRARGGQYYGQALREAMNTVVAIENTEPLHNDSYVDALFLTDIMLQHTYRSMDILTGSCVGQFFDVLASSFCSALDRIKNMKGLVRIIIMDSDGEVPVFLKKFVEDGYPVKVNFANSVANVSHLFVCDKKMVRDEKYHKPLTSATLASEIKADVYLNSPIDARIKTDHFESFWEYLENHKSAAVKGFGG